MLDRQKSGGKLGRSATSSGSPTARTGDEPPEFSKMKILVGEDATAYAKLLMSVYLFGNNAAYDGDCGRVGGISSFHCARDRYGFQIIRRPDKDRTGKSVMVSDFRTPEQVEAATEEFMDRCKRNNRFCYLFGPKLV